MKRLSLSLFGMLLLVTLNSCAKNISSSELVSTSAEDLKVTSLVEETNGQENVSANSLLKTIPDDVGVKFNQGETLTMSSTISGELTPSVSLTYNDNFLDFGEQYIGVLDKPVLGDTYTLTYSDKDDTETTIAFSSQGVPDLITPTAGQDVFLGEDVTLTWTGRDLGALRVVVRYDTLAGGSGLSNLSASDTGSYTLDLSTDAFDNASTGEATIQLVHYTDYDDFAGFGAADVKVKSVSEAEVIFRRR